MLVMRVGGRRKKVIIMGAAGRDFHNFNVFFRNNPDYEVVAFTQAQIPGIEERTYPPELAGDLYPNGIKMYPESMLPQLIKKHDVDLVVLSYSDLSFTEVMDKASIAASCGASFMLLGPKDTMIESKKPVIAVTAVRTGAGKSSVSRKLLRLFKDKNLNVAVIRHPMPYAENLAAKAVERFRNIDDALNKMKNNELSIEELEEFEQYLVRGFEVWCGVDYEKILRGAEENADVILWDGGNNDFPFIKPSYMITVADALRPGHELRFYPGSVNIRLCDVVVINKIGVAPFDNWKQIVDNVKRVNSRADIILAESRISVEDPDMIRNKKVLVVEDGPTVTHGGAEYAAGFVAAKLFNAGEIVDPTKYIPKGSKLYNMYETYPHLKKLLPTIGYDEEQIRVLLDVINSVDADVVVSGTPIDLRRIFRIYNLEPNKPIVHVKYELVEVSELTLKDVVDKFVEKFVG